MTSWASELSRAEVMGIDLGHESDLALVRLYLVELSHQRFRAIPKKHRATLRLQGVVGLTGRGHDLQWCLTAKGLSWVAECS